MEKYSTKINRHMDTTEKLSGIPERLKRILKIRNYSQKELAESIGITEVTISRYLKGNRIPSAENILAMAFVLDVSSDYLLGLNDDFHSQEKGYIPVDKALEYCQKAGEGWNDFQNKALENIGHGDSYGGSFAAVAFGASQAEMYMYRIPEILRTLSDQKKEEER